MPNNTNESFSSGIICALSCPECSGPLWEIKMGRGAEYRCDVGHAYSARTLDAAQRTVIERATWEALRAAKDTSALDDRLAEQAASYGLEQEAATYRRSAADKRLRVQALLSVLTNFYGAPVAARPTETARTPATVVENFPVRRRHAERLPGSLKVLAGWFHQPGLKNAERRGEPSAHPVLP